MTRRIERSTTFKKDYKREAKGRYRNILAELLAAVLTDLIADEKLSQRFRDHELTGNWVGYRECHLKPDLLLIYSKLGKTTLRLVRLGFHSELFG